MAHGQGRKAMVTIHCLAGRPIGIACDAETLLNNAEVRRHGGFRKVQTLTR